jgi:DNA-binding SARP family transcriptional activator
MDFRVLGMFEVADGDTIVTPSAPKLRRVLALLAVHANSLVHTWQLVDELWGERQPASSSTTLQTYIYQLRKLLCLAEHGQQTALYTRPSGYLLSVPAQALDLRRFEELASRGAEEMRRGSIDEASATLRAALDLWRGPALSDVDTGPVLQADVVHLDELRTSTLELRLDADLRLGRCQQLVGELTRQSSLNPTHEGLHGRLMLALYRCGRRSEALQVFQKVRGVLADELGLEPGPELQRMHRAILASDPDLDCYGGAPIVAGRTASPVDPPAQLPPAVPIVGRDAQLAQIKRLVTDRPDDAPVTVSVVGAPGIGTSAFCVRAAHDLRAAFPGGQFFASFARSPEPAEVLGGFLQATGVPAESIPADLDGRSAMFRTWTAERKVVVVLDDVTSPAQVVPLLPSGPGCATLVASHRRLCDHTIRAVLELGPLTTEQSLELLRGVAGRDRVQRDLAAARDLVLACGGIPLALRAAGTRLALRPHWRVSHLTQRLAAESSRLHELAASNLDLRDSVGRRYRLLSPAHRDAFHRIAAHRPGPVATDEVARLLGTDEDTAESILEHLVEFQLAGVDDAQAPTADGFRYRLHPLVRLAAHALREDAHRRPRLVSVGAQHSAPASIPADSVSGQAQVPGRRTASAPA